MVVIGVMFVFMFGVMFVFCVMFVLMFSVMFVFLTLHVYRYVWQSEASGH